MNYGFFSKGSQCTFLVLVLLGSQVLGQNPDSHSFNYISPVPGSNFIMPENNIALRHGDLIDWNSVTNMVFEVEGTKSGRIEGKIVMSDDQKTIIFLPDKPFEFGEQVYVKTSGPVETKSGLPLNSIDFSFRVTEHIPVLPNNYIMNEELKFHQSFFSKNTSEYTPLYKSVKDNNLPADFPELTVEVMNDTFDNGYYFVSPFGYWGWFPDNVPYLIIFDDHAVPVYYQKLDAHAYDFKLNKTGLLSYLYNDWQPVPYYQILNASFEEIDQYTMQNGYTTDFHEFLMLENGHVIVMDTDPQIIDMSLVVPGGVEDATVIGWVFQELDINKNVVFQWRSWDHYDILDAEGYVSLTSSTIDLIHGNAIEVTPDNALLLSPRNLNEITKVDRNTGEIIWRLNGNNNMFEFINDTLGFSWQHDCRVLANGNISIFDNGTYYPEPQFSSMVEYDLDEENFTATLVRRLRNDPDIFGTIMGSAREAQNGNIVTGWGSGVPGVTEFNPEGDVAATYYFSGINYRAYRYPWSTTYFEPGVDHLNFGYVWKEDQKTKNIHIFNNQSVDIEITSYYLQTNNFIVENELPVTIPAEEYTTLQVTFIPAETGSYADVLTLNSDINTEELVQRIAQQVDLAGHGTEGQGVGNFSEIKIAVSPNPVKNLAHISFEKNIENVAIKLFDQTGRQVLHTSYSGISKCTLDMSTLAEGMYFLEVHNDIGKMNTRIKIIKNN